MTLCFQGAPRGMRTAPLQRAIAALVLLLFVVCAARMHAEGDAGTPVSSGQFGPLVHSMVSLESYQRYMATSTNPVVMFIFDHRGVAMPNFWAPLLREISKGFAEFGIEVAAVPSSSQAGRELGAAMGIGENPAIFFFQGVGDTPGEGGQALKMPVAYQGSVDIPNILSWGLSCISSSVTRRIHNDVDLAHFFALAPQYPNLPHVLYFPSTGHTPAGYLTVSQHFSSDAIFGVVPNAFATPNATAIAQRYNITSASELPALLVLHKAAADDVDGGDGEFDRVVRMPQTNAPLNYREVKAFLSSQITDTIASLVEQAEATGSGHLLGLAEKRRVYMLAQLVERQADVVEEERLQLARVPVVVEDHEMWAKACVQQPKKHRCLAAFVDSTQDPAAKENAMKVLSIVSVRLLETLAMEAQKVALVIVDRAGSDAVRKYFEVGQNGFPDVLFLSLDRPAKYFNFVGAFSAEGIVQFILSHDPQVAKRDVRGGHAFIPRMVPKLERASATPGSTDGDDGGDL